MAIEAQEGRYECPYASWTGTASSSTPKRYVKANFSVGMIVLDVHLLEKNTAAGYSEISIILNHTSRYHIT